MGRAAALTVLPDWAECDRCTRHRTAIGTCRPAWARRPRVLVLHLRGSRSEEALGRPGGRVAGHARELARLLGLGVDDVVVDYLLGCGSRGDAQPEDVATCSGRFVDNVARVGGPDLVVAVGTECRDALDLAGLLGGNLWRPLGLATGVPFAVIAPGMPRERDAEALRAGLGTTRAKEVGRVELSGLAHVLHDCLGTSLGIGEKSGDSPWWREKRSRGPTLQEVTLHLRGEVPVDPGVPYFVSLFRPRGHWRFAVIDIDRHDAISDAEFDETLQRVRAIVPHGFVVQSSSSGGAHVYVRLPAGTQFDEGATWIRARLALAELLVADRRIKRGGHTTVLRATLAEVPKHGVRLPFGIGSSQWGSAASLSKQLQAFATFVHRAPDDDFAEAREYVSQRLGIGTAWSRDKRLRLEREIEARELASLRVPALDVDDPWRDVMPLLTEAASKVACSGVPAIGTRMTWTLRLVRELLEWCEPARVTELMLHWLRHRDHSSADISADTEGVALDLAALVDREARQLGEVPEAVWAYVDAKVREAYGEALQGAHGTPQAGFDGVVSLEWVRLIAFRIVRAFYGKGTRERITPAREFAWRTAPENGALIAKILARGDWLVVAKPVVPGRRGAIYRLVLPPSLAEQAPNPNGSSPGLAALPGVLPVPPRGRVSTRGPSPAERRLRARQEAESVRRAESVRGKRVTGPATTTT